MLGLSFSFRSSENPIKSVNSPVASDSYDAESSWAELPLLVPTHDFELQKAVRSAFSQSRPDSKPVVDFFRRFENKRTAVSSETETRRKVCLRPADMVANIRREVIGTDVDL